MNSGKKLSKDYYVIDVMHIVKSVWHRAWVIALCALVFAGIGFSLAAFVITPTYSSSVMLYVNNKSIADEFGLSISSSDFTASQNLVKTYSVILKNKTTLEEVIDESGVSYSWKELNSRISVSSVNETQIMQVTVTTENPYEAEEIASSISKVLRRKGEDVTGAPIKEVDAAAVNTEKVAPSVTNFTALGGAVGVVLSLIVLVALAMMDNTIHDEEYILQNYDYPILAKVPNLLSSGSGRYYNRYNYYYKKESK